MADERLTSRARRNRQRRDQMEEERRKMRERSAHVQELVEQEEQAIKQLERELEKHPEEAERLELLEKIEEHEARSIAAREKLIVDQEKLIADMLEVLFEYEATVAEVELEHGKLRSEALKHQATFSGAAVVSIATITQVLLPASLSATYLLWITYALLLVTVSISLLLMHEEVRTARRTFLGLDDDSRSIDDDSRSMRRREEERRRKVSRRLYQASCFGFPVSTAIFGIFMWINLG